jgi:hypothetical protein
MECESGIVQDKNSDDICGWLWEGQDHGFYEQLHVIQRHINSIAYLETRFVHSELLELRAPVAILKLLLPPRPFILNESLSGGMSKGRALSDAEVIIYRLNVQVWF